MRILTTYTPQGKVRYAVNDDDKLTLLEDKADWEVWDHMRKLAIDIEAHQKVMRAHEDISIKMTNDFDNFAKGIEG